MNKLLESKKEFPKSQELTDIGLGKKKEQKPIIRKLIFYFTLALGIFDFYSLVISPVTPWVYLAVNFGASYIINIFVYKGYFEKHKKVSTIIDIILIVLVILCASYFALEYNELIWRRISPTTLDKFCAFFAILIVLEGTRRIGTFPLSLIASGFLLYAVFGNYMPGFLRHGGFSITRIIMHLYGETGIFATPLAVASTFVFLFIVFGAFLKEFGGGKVFIDLATGIAGHLRGGPAKVAVIASALFGTVAGSSIANVATTGAFTIPLMKKVGYKPTFAAGVEAAASTGGQIMPPVMGSTAFILAEMVGVAYFTVVTKAVVPAILYFLAVLIMVDIEAARTNLKGIPRKELPVPIKILKEEGIFLLPLIIIFTSLVAFRVTPTRAGIYGIATILIVPFFSRGNNVNLSKILNALHKGVLGVVPIMAACVTASLVIGVLSLTGLGIRLGFVLVDISRGYLFPLLVIAMLLSLILGMGLPTVASYIVAASVVGPALVRAGVPMLHAHLFIFYFSLLAMVTPPVCLASYTAAGIAGVDPNKVGWKGLQLSFAAFVIPYMFIYAPGLLLEGPALVITYNLFTAIIGIVVLSSAVQGYFLGAATTRIQRAFLFIISILFMLPGTYNVLIGLVLTPLVILINTKTRSNFKKILTIGSDSSKIKKND